VAGFDDVVSDYFVEDAHRFWEGVVVVAKGEEECFYCCGLSDWVCHG
jgi:hypothetical protein